MRIVQISNSFKPAWQTGGTCRVAYEISYGLVKRGHRVTVLTTDRGFGLLAPKGVASCVDGIKVIYYHDVMPSAIGKSIPLPLQAVFHEMTDIDKANIVHIHEHRSVLSIIASNRCIKNKIPYVIQTHGSMPYNIGKGTLKNMFDSLEGDRILFGASALIAITNNEAEMLEDRGVDSGKIWIIPNSLDLSEYRSLPLIGEFRKKMGINSRNLILYLGRLDKTKGVDLLIRSFSLISSIRKDTSLAIVGPDAGEKKNLMKLVLKLNLSDKVFFCDFVDHDMKLSAILDSCMLVCPSYSGFPIVFLEACVCSRPIVTTTRGDALEWLDGTVGVVAEHSPEGLAEAIDSLLNDQERMKQFGEKGSDLIKTEFNWEKNLDKLLQVYDCISK